MSRATVLVVGGAGFVGSHAAKALARAGWTPVVYDSLMRGFAEAVRWGPLIRAELEDRAALAAAFATYQPRAVLHFGGVIAVGESARDPGLYYRHNVAATTALLDSVRDHGAPPVVFSSTAAVYGDPVRIPMDESHPTRPLSPYGRTKLMVEAMLADFAAAHGLAWMAPRYFNAAGADPDGEIGENHAPETHLIPLAIDAALDLRPPLALFGEDYPTRDGTCVRDYVHVADLADAHVAAVERLLAGAPSGPVNLGTGRGATVREVLAVVGEVVGRPVPFRAAPRREGDAPELVADPARARALLDWAPRRSDLATMVADAHRWLARPDRAPQVAG